MQSLTVKLLTARLQLPFGDISSGIWLIVVEVVEEASVVGIEDVVPLTGAVGAVVVVVPSLLPGQAVEPEPEGLTGVEVVSVVVIAEGFAVAIEVVAAVIAVVVEAVIAAVVEAAGVAGRPQKSMCESTPSISFSSSLLLGIEADLFAAHAMASQTPIPRSERSKMPGKRIGCPRTLPLAH